MLHSKKIPMAKEVGEIQQALSPSWGFMAEVLQEKKKRNLIDVFWPRLIPIGHPFIHLFIHLSSIHLAIDLNIWLLKINCVNPCATLSTHSPYSYFPTFYPHQNLHGHYQSSSSPSQLPAFIYSKLTLLSFLHKCYPGLSSLHPYEVDSVKIIALQTGTLKRWSNLVKKHRWQMTKLFLGRGLQSPVC